MRLLALRGDAGPVVGSVGKALVGGVSADDDAALARPLGHRGHAAQADGCLRIGRASAAGLLLGKALEMPRERTPPGCKRSRQLPT